MLKPRALVLGPSLDGGGASTVSSTPPGLAARSGADDRSYSSASCSHHSRCAKPWGSVMDQRPAPPAVLLLTPALLLAGPLPPEPDRLKALLPCVLLLDPALRLRVPPPLVKVSLSAWWGKLEEAELLDL